MIQQPHPITSASCQEGHTARDVPIRPPMAQVCCCKVTAMMMVDPLAGTGADFVGEGGRSIRQQLLPQLPPLLHRLHPNLPVPVLLRHLPLMPLPLHMPLHLLRLHMWILYLNPKWIAAQPGGSDASSAKMIANGGDAATTSLGLCNF